MSENAQVAQAPAESTSTPPAEAPKAEAPKAEAPKAEAPKAEAPKAEPEYVIKPPEGMQVDEKAVNGFVETAKQHKLSPEQTQAVASYYFSMQKAAQESIGPALKAYEEKCLVDLKADKEFGGAAYEANVALARKTFIRFGSESLVKELQELGLGSHPGLMRMALKIGKAISEDSTRAPQTSKPTEGQSRDALLRTLYPTMFTK